VAKAKTNQEWWHEKALQLQEQTKPFVGIDPDVIYEKPGFWPALKLVFMKYSLGFYTPIMSANRAAGIWDSLHFIDLCAGSGLTRLKAVHYPSKTVTVTGSALIGAHESRFDHYHLVEPHAASARALTARLASKLPAGSFTVYDEPSAAAIPKITANLQAVSRNPHFMAFVDPEGLTEVTLPSLHPLFDLGRGDFLFNYQYQAVRRVPQALATSFFGADEWPRIGPERGLQDYFLSRLRAFGRPASMRLSVAAGKGSGRYAYDMVYCAAQTRDGNPWLKSLETEVAKRMSGLDGAKLENFILGGQQMLF